MKKFLGILVLALLLVSCSDKVEEAFNACINEVKGTEYEGTVLNEAGATVVCQELKKKMPDIFRRSEGKILSFLKMK